MAKKKTHEYEIDLSYIGKGRKPAYMRTEYGFRGNPPIVIRAKDVASAKKQLKLPSTVKIRRIKRVS